MATFCSSPSSALCLSGAAATTPPVHAGKATRRSPSWRALLPIGLGSVVRTTLPTAPSAARLRPFNALREGGVEPDLPEDDFEDLRTAGEAEEDSFPFGVADGHHTYHEGDDGTVWEGFQEVFASAGGATGGQAVLAWLTLPVLYMGIAFNVQVEYIFLGMVLFIFAFIGVEMAKPAKPHEYPPEIYRQLKKK